MAQLQSTLAQKGTVNKKVIWFAAIFLLFAAAGLFYVKWYPYYFKSFSAAATHSIGNSILGDPSKPASFSWDSAVSYALAYFNAVWKAAILGILLGSLIQVLLPSQWLIKVLGKTSFGSTAAGGLASIPGMMCTCCAAPMAVGLRKKKVSVGAALAFWLGNPAINPATLVFMTFVLSWKFTLLRLVFGVILTFGVSYLANHFIKDSEEVDLDQLMEKTEMEQEEPFFVRWMKSIGMMLLYIVPAYVVSVLLVGAARIWLFPHVGEAAANSILVVIEFAIAGMLFVIPTAAEIPIIQSFLAFGLGTGPAGALLLTLPSISLPSLLIVGRSFPAKVLIFTAVSVVVLGILCGLTGMLIL
ncbi:permease [Metabacillus sp. RGM 3146]|uniref:permease n=1 Tax=Metabacillus sp. RGM 3146 TaxID=3401092 RepID=UPI003B9D0EDB